ncbi:MAG TPA: hypothetical protein VL357_09080 [Rariglobus sp.]|nr:hypothetical protein [Rariglobus sp.]
MSSIGKMTRKFSIMVAVNLRYVSELAGPGRLGFVATNGLQDYLVIEGQHEDEYRQRVREGWRVAEIRPICRSITPKLMHTHPDLLKARAFSYSLIILEHPALALMEKRQAPSAVAGSRGAENQL